MTATPGLRMWMSPPSSVPALDFRHPGLRHIAKLMGPAIIGILTMVLIWLSLWLFLSLFFVTPAIVLDDANVATAVWRSVNVVVRNFWGTVGLWLLTQFILVGFSLIWQRLSQWPLGGVVGIFGNAYLATGLIAASIYFYQDRYARWQTQRAARRQI